ncbi:unnamed protein product [Didymodactylos carnosus]|uniref:Uncharacterized protein n=1 Tax=Didymodactylos carnosus TaxID=1234261 RepID=A0A814RSP8_9BILA|nr:unnamed protein product [Didymodactylos carnosus]CAF1137787.1 unnamed protein product [Didymodactylos carnosus]CAF3711269.1 unnamed protein product [Didymodactylos carnosus]CAF3901544.1 unnamed protein product [Didymodactylos carnosus]
MPTSTVPYFPQRTVSGPDGEQVPVSCIKSITLEPKATTGINASTTSNTSATSATSTTTSPPCSLILNLTNLVAYFPFDNGSILDSGPNSLTSTITGQTQITGERNQGFSFIGTTTSYFQVSGLTSLGTVNLPFSIALWIKPTNLSGSFVHVSRNAAGDGWCLPFIGFTSSNLVATQVWDGSTAQYTLGPLLTRNTWTHVVQTFSVTNGLKLYVSGSLYNTTSGITQYSASGSSMYMSAGGTAQVISNPTSCTSTGVLGLNSYSGGVDELRIYSRELTANDVCALFYY